METKKGTARERLLSAAAQLFYNDGIGATGIDAITAKAGVAKMSLYNNFSSKADLVQTYIETRHAEWLGLYKKRLKNTASPTERVLAIFEAYADHAEFDYARGFRGCGLLNAAAEFPAGDPARQAVRKHKEEVERLLQGHLSEIDSIPSTEIPGLAEHLAFLLEGAMSRAGLEGHGERVHHAKTIAAGILKSHA